jgi:hypothetical protein
VVGSGKQDMETSGSVEERGMSQPLEQEGTRLCSEELLHGINNE